MALVFFVVAGALGCVAVYQIFQATTLGYRIDRRSHPERYAPNAPEHRLKLLAIAINWRVARDGETQALRRRMNLKLLAALLCAIGAGVAVSIAANSS